MNVLFNIFLPHELKGASTMRFKKFDKTIFHDSDGDKKISRGSK